jgi:hypothetical protein
MNMENDNVTKTTAEKLISMAGERKKAATLSKEESEELKKACNYVFSSPEGKLIGKYMMRVCGIYRFPDINFDLASMAFQKGMIYMYKLFVLGMVDKIIVNEIEMEKGGEE